MKEMNVRELKAYRREVQEDELWPANDSGSQEKISAARQKLNEIDAVLKEKIEERFWLAQQREWKRSE